MISLDLLKPKKITVVLEDKTETGVLANNRFEFDDVKVFLEPKESSINIYCDAQKSLIRHIYLYYDLDVNKDDLIYGDAFERGYGDLSWSKVSEKQMFWYFFICNNDENSLFGCGCEVHPGSIVSFKIIGSELRVDLNTCSGGQGVNLEGRRLCVASLLCKNYNNQDVFDSMKSFLSLLMGDTKMLSLKENVYGFNNWYYAYGKSSYKEIINDSKLLSELTKGLKTRPFMVIDDGWSIYPTTGPWIPNDDFNDMKSLAKEIKSMNIKPGIWIRPLKDVGNGFKNERHPLNKDLLDPSSPEVKEFVSNEISKLVENGYELIKFDFITWDIFNLYGFEMNEELTKRGWRYKENHFTNAEIILDLYKTIREAAKDKVLIGCNAVPHFAAGLVEINRIGDDTSGFEWERTRKYGVNSLAFRLIQNDVFYKIDADCVGIIGDKIDWPQNKQWLDLLSVSRSPLFVSCNPHLVTEEMKKDISNAFKVNEKQINMLKPLSWFREITPSEWLVDGKTRKYNWYFIK